MWRKRPTAAVLKLTGTIGAGRTTSDSELIDNTFDGFRTRYHGSAEPAGTPADVPSSGLGPQLTPTVQRRRASFVGVSDYLAQGDCRVCKTARSTLVCWTCRSTPGKSDVSLCGLHTGRECFATHLASVHQISRSQGAVARRTPCGCDSGGRGRRGGKAVRGRANELAATR